MQHLLAKAKLKSARRSQQTLKESTKADYQVPWEFAESKSPCADHYEPGQSGTTARGQLN